VLPSTTYSTPLLPSGNAQSSKPVNALQKPDSFSAHGDKNEMCDFISNQKTALKQLFLVHGELETQKSFKYFLHDKGFNMNIDIPSPGQEIEIKT